MNKQLFVKNVQKLYKLPHFYEIYLEFSFPYELIAEASGFSSLIFFNRTN
jgi:hypothetical protein